MKNLILIFTFLFIHNTYSMTSSQSINLDSQNLTWGIGVTLGAPTGVSGVYHVNKNAFIDMMVGYDFSGYFNFHSDYFLLSRDAYSFDKISMNLYYGVGVRVKNRQEEEFLFGPRMAIGTNHFFEKAPVEFAAEIGGIMSLVERTDFDLEAVLNIRYHF